MLVENVWRKSEGLKEMVKNKTKDHAKLKENFLDLINYTAMVVVRMKDENFTL